MDGTKYLYKGRVLSVQQTFSDLKYGIISCPPRSIATSANYRWVKNSSLGRYDSREEAQAALDAFARSRKLPAVER